MSNVMNILPGPKTFARTQILKSWIISLAYVKFLFKTYFGYNIFICQQIFKFSAAHFTKNSGKKIC